jgi:outer membrane lipoprotein-sorting protein
MPRTALHWTLALAAGAAFLLAACSDNADATGFYAEITVEVEPQADDPLARIGAATEGGGSIRWWYEAPDRWRWEIETDGPTLDAGTLLTVSDGEALWTYDDRLDMYQRTELYATPNSFILLPTSSAPVGPANAESVEAFMKQWRERGSDMDVRLGGEETVLGRRTQIVEIRPAWRSGSSSAATAPAAGEEAAASTEGPESSGGVIRIFIDPERMFIMRWAVDGEGGGQSYSAEITALEYGEPIDETLFVFEPPPGAREASTPASGGGCRTTLGGPGFSVPKGFLRPLYVPQGFNSSGSGAQSGADGCELVATWSLLEDGDDGYVLLRQRRRPDGIPAALRTGERVKVNGRDGFASQDAGVIQVVWADGEIVAQLTSNALSPAELLLTAQSAELVATGDG